MSVKNEKREDIDSKFFERMFQISSFLFAVSATLYGVFMAIHFSLYNTYIQLLTINKSAANEIYQILENYIILNYAFWSGIFAIVSIYMVISILAFLHYDRLSEKTKSLLKVVLLTLTVIVLSLILAFFIHDAIYVRSGISGPEYFMLYSIIIFTIFMTIIFRTIN